MTQGDWMKRFVYLVFKIHIASEETSNLFASDDYEKTKKFFDMHCYDEGNMYIIEKLCLNHYYKYLYPKRMVIRTFGKNGEVYDEKDVYDEGVLNELEC